MSYATKVYLYTTNCLVKPFIRSQRIASLEDPQLRLLLHARIRELQLYASKPLHLCQNVPHLIRLRAPILDHRMSETAAGEILAREVLRLVIYPSLLHSPEREKRSTRLRGIIAYMHVHIRIGEGYALVQKLHRGSAGIVERGDVREKRAEKCTAEYTANEK